MVCFGGNEDFLLAGNQSTGDKIGGKESWFETLWLERTSGSKLAQPLHIPDKERKCRETVGFAQGHTTCSRQGTEASVPCLSSLLERETGRSCRKVDYQESGNGQSASQA